MDFPAIVGAPALEVETRMEHQVVVGVVEGAVVEGAVVEIILLILLLSMLGLQTIIYQHFLTHSAVQGVETVLNQGEHPDRTRQNIIYLEILRRS